MIQQNDDEFMLLHQFVAETRLKCDMIAFAFENLNKELEARNFGPSGSVFFWIQTILLHSAGVSLVFWPNKSSAERGARLRAAFAMPQELEYLGSRTIRNHIAHLDERLESWWANSKNKNIFRSVIGRRATIFGDETTTQDIIEHYVPEERLFIFRGDEYDMQKLFTAILAIRNKSHQLSNFNWWSGEFKSAFAP